MCINVRPPVRKISTVTLETDRHGREHSSNSSSTQKHSLDALSVDSKRLHKKFPTQTLPRLLLFTRVKHTPWQLLLLLHHHLLVENPNCRIRQNLMNE
jgi:hypothetical protein